MKRNLLCMLGLAILLSSCSRELESLTESVEHSSSKAERVDPLRAQLLSADVSPHTLYIKVEDTAASRMSLEQSGTLALHSAPSALANALAQVQATSVRPVFDIDPRFRKRSERAGLHQWYIVDMAESQDLYSAAVILQSIPDVSFVEPAYRIALPDVQVTPVPEPQTNANGLPFDDPRLAGQWHYHNDGKGRNRAAGADINVFGVWRAGVIGKPNVIVSIVDGGIDTAHPDLEKNLYVNQKEKDGQEGVDDDGNGKVDDIYGFNFITKKGEIYPDYISHGTHVAGTVGARNNNGIGVSGIAGGDDKKTEETGVRLMSCQIFGKEITLSNGKKGMESANAAPAYVYAADNGSVISQNSWGYTYPGVSTMPRLMKDAIDYFIKNAGCDDNGEQLENSPMKGGVVIFAAGNDNKDYLAFPGAYEPTISVASMGPDWERASYSNRGTWVDITAPGGDVSTGWTNQVLSTINNNAYGLMQGTSMACPHVSGVAALIVSHHGKKGFTNKDLERILLASLHDRNVDKANPNDAGRMGLGYLDAMKMFDVDGKQSPLSPTSLTAIDVLYTTATFNWNAVTDPDDGVASHYNLYIDTKPLTNESYKQSFLARVNARGVTAGDAMSLECIQLQQETKYYVAIEAIDRWGNTSSLARTEFTTKKNNAPVLNRTNNDPIRVGGKQTATVIVRVTDPDKHTVSVKLGGQTLGVSHTLIGEELKITFAAMAPIGQHRLSITATDEHGLESVLEIPFEVYLYKAPKFNKKVDQQPIGLGANLTLDIAKIVTATEGLKLDYSVELKPKGLAEASIDANGQLVIKGFKRGAAQAIVTVDDRISTPIKTVIDLRVVSNVNDLIYSVFPIPAETELNIDVNPKVPGVKVMILTPEGLVVYDREFVTRGRGSLKIPVKDFAIGTYILRVSSPRETYTKTFVKR